MTDYPQIMKYSWMIAGFNKTGKSQFTRVLSNMSSTPNPSLHDAIHKDCRVPTHQGKHRWYMAHLSGISNFMDVTISSKGVMVTEQRVGL